MILHEIFREVSRLPRYISCYIAESWFLLGQCSYSDSLPKFLAIVRNISRNIFRFVFCNTARIFSKFSQLTLLEGLGPIPLPQARAASPIRTTSGILLSNMYPSHSGNLSSPWSGKYFWLYKDANRIRSHVSPIPGAAALTTWPSNTWQSGNLFIKQ